MSTVAPPQEQRLTSVDRRTAEEGVLEVPRDLLAEIRGGPPPAPVTLDDLFDRDHGLGSLERVEILLRLEKRFRGLPLWPRAGGWREIVWLRDGTRDEISRGFD